MPSVSDQAIRLVIAGVLLLHGLGHGGALGALIWLRLRPASNAGGWLDARSWLAPGLPSTTAEFAAGAFWVVSMVGFVGAVVALFLVPGDAWRVLAVDTAFVSTIGIVLFLGTWPLFNTLAALAVNVAVLVALLWLHWPPEAMFGT